MLTVTSAAPSAATGMAGANSSKARSAQLVEELNNCAPTAMNFSKEGGPEISLSVLDGKLSKSLLQQLAHLAETQAETIERLEARQVEMQEQIKTMQATIEHQAAELRMQAELPPPSLPKKLIHKLQQLDGQSAQMKAELTNLAHNIQGFVSGSAAPDVDRCHDIAPDRDLERHLQPRWGIFLHRVAPETTEESLRALLHGVCHPRTVLARQVGVAKNAFVELASEPAAGRTVEALGAIEHAELLRMNEDDMLHCSMLVSNCPTNCSHAEVADRLAVHLAGCSPASIETHFSVADQSNAGVALVQFGDIFSLQSAMHFLNASPMDGRQLAARGLTGFEEDRVREVLTSLRKTSWSEESVVGGRTVVLANLPAAVESSALRRKVQDAGVVFEGLSVLLDDLHAGMGLAVVTLNERVDQRVLSRLRELKFASNEWRTSPAKQPPLIAVPLLSVRTVEEAKREHALCAASAQDDQPASGAPVDWAAKWRWAIRLVIKIRTASSTHGLLACRVDTKMSVQERMRRIEQQLFDDRSAVETHAKVALARHVSTTERIDRTDGHVDEVEAKFDKQLGQLKEEVAYKPEVAEACDSLAQSLTAEFSQRLDEAKEALVERLAGDSRKLEEALQQLKHSRDAVIRQRAQNLSRKTADLVGEGQGLLEQLNAVDSMSNDKERSPLDWLTDDWDARAMRHAVHDLRAQAVMATQEAAVLREKVKEMEVEEEAESEMEQALKTVQDHVTQLTNTLDEATAVFSAFDSAIMEGWSGMHDILSPSDDPHPAEALIAKMDKLQSEVNDKASTEALTVLESEVRADMKQLGDQQDETDKQVKTNVRKIREVESQEAQTEAGLQLLQQEIQKVKDSMPEPLPDIEELVKDFVTLFLEKHTMTQATPTPERDDSAVHELQSKLASIASKIRAELEEKADLKDINSMLTDKANRGELKDKADAEALLELEELLSSMVQGFTSLRAGVEDDLSKAQAELEARLMAEIEARVHTGKPLGTRGLFDTAVTVRSMVSGHPLEPDEVDEGANGVVNYKHKILPKLHGHWSGSEVWRGGFRMPVQVGASRLRNTNPTAKALEPNFTQVAGPNVTALDRPQQTQDDLLRTQISRSPVQSTRQRPGTAGPTRSSNMTVGSGMATVTSVASRTPSSSSRAKRLEASRRSAPKGRTVRIQTPIGSTVPDTGTSQDRVSSLTKEVDEMNERDLGRIQSGPPAPADWATAPGQGHHPY